MDLLAGKLARLGQPGAQARTEEQHQFRLLRRRQLLRRLLNFRERAHGRMMLRPRGRANGAGCGRPLIIRNRKPEKV
jgi:hypothetical protein